MALQAPTQTVSNRVVQPALDVGSYPGRISRIIDLGLQPTTDFATKGPGKPVHKISVTYELLDEFMVDSDGNIQEDKPRWIAEDFPLKPMSLDLATSTKRMRVVDPQDKLKGDWSQALALPVMVSIGQYKSKKDPDTLKNKVLGTTIPRAKDIQNMPDLKNEAKFFDLSNPDIEFFNSLPSWQQDVIKGNLEYAGSPLEALLSGKSPTPKAKEDQPTPAPQVEADDGDEDAPW